MRESLTLYARSYCHLCDDMIAKLRELEPELGFTVDIVDVDHDTKLEERFGERVPVLMAGDIELSHYHLDSGRLRAYFAEKR